MKFLQVFVITCLCLVYTHANVCSKKAPREKSLKVSGNSQSYRLRRKIEYYLRKYPAVRYDVERIAHHNRDAIAESEYKYYGYSTCPAYLKYVTRVYHRGGYCYVVRPDDQAIPFATCKKRSCYGCAKGRFSSVCLRDQYRVYKFWVYCKSGFYLIYKSLPQCCSCYYYYLC